MLTLLGCGEGLRGKCQAQEWPRRSYSSPDVCLWKLEPLDGWGGLQRSLERKPFPSSRLHPHGLGVSILPSVHFLSSWWYPELGIIQPGNQAGSLMSAPGCIIDFFFISCPLLTHNCNHVTFNRDTKRSPSQPHTQSLANKMEELIKRAVKKIPRNGRQEVMQTLVNKGRGLGRRERV